MADTRARASSSETITTINVVSWDTTIAWRCTVAHRAASDTCRRLIRAFTATEDAVDIQFQMEIDSQNETDSSTPVGVDLHMEPDGRNTSIYARYLLPSRQIRIGNATFYKKGHAKIDLIAPNGTVTKLRFRHDWFTNPNKILDEDGKEVARTLLKSAFFGKHLSICFPKDKHELGMVLDAIAQNFQIQGEHCKGVTLTNCIGNSCYSYKVYGSCTGVYLGSQK